MFIPSLDQQLVYDAIVGDSRRATRHLAIGASPLYMDPVHGSALIHAVQHHSIPMIALLLDHGADANAVSAKTGKSALDHALDLIGHRTVTDLCTHGRAALAALKPEDLIELDMMTWPQSFFEIFGIHCLFDCCAWKACDFGPAGLDSAMATTGLGLEEIAYLANEITSTPAADFGPQWRHGKDMHEHLDHLFNTIQDHQAKQP